MVLGQDLGSKTKRDGRDGPERSPSEARSPRDAGSNPKCRPNTFRKGLLEDRLDAFSIVIRCRPSIEVLNRWEAEVILGPWHIYGLPSLD